MDVSAATACFTGWKKLAHLGHIGATGLGLVVAHAYKFGPSRIGNAFSKIVIFNHAFNIQRFQADKSEIGGYSVAEFVEKIFPLVGCVLMQPCNFNSGLGSIGGTLTFAGQSLLSLGQFFLGFPKILRTINGFTS